ncbi:MAG: hypothetical protein R2711_13985 [Acidimicrobiales bacterium]
MIRLDAATFLLQWATGGLLFTWVTTRRREVGLGYGWLMRAVRDPGAGLHRGRSVPRPGALRDLAALGVVLAAGAALAVSVQRRAAGVRGQRDVVERRSAGGGDDRHRPRRAALRQGGRRVPAPPRHGGPRPRDARVGGGGHRRRRPGLAVGAAPGGRGRLPGRRHRRHAARPLVPRAAGPGAGRCSSWCGGRAGSGRSRSACC